MKALVHGHREQDRLDNLQEVIELRGTRYVPDVHGKKLYYTTTDLDSYCLH
jgi:hypothetical protein